MTFLAAILVTWALAGLLVLSIGWLAIRIFAPAFTGKASPDLGTVFWCGISVVSAWASAFWLVAPVTVLMWICIYVALIGLFGIVALNRKTHSSFATHSVGTSLMQRKPTRIMSIFGGAFVTAVVVLTAVRSTVTPTALDALNYHLPLIAWVNSTGAPFGVANLQWLFGVFTLGHLWGGAFSLGPWSGSGYVLVIGFFELGLLIDSVLLIHKAWRKSSRGTLWVAAGQMIVSLILIAISWNRPDLWLSFPAPDLILAVLFCAASTRILLLIIRYDSFLAFTAAALVALVSATRITYVAWSISMILMIALIAWNSRVVTNRVEHIAGVGSSRRNYTVAARLIWIVSLGIAILILVVFTRIILSGYLLYPLTLFWVDVDWRVESGGTLGLSNDRWVAFGQSLKAGAVLGDTVLWISVICGSTTLLVWFYLRKRAPWMLV